MTRFSVPDRVGAACGSAYIVLILVGNSLGNGGDNDPHPSGATVLAHFSETPSATEQVGFAMETVGFVAFMFFLGWLVSTLRGRGGPWSWLTAVAAVAGITALAVKVGSMAPILAWPTTATSRRAWPGCCWT